MVQAPARSGIETTNARFMAAVNSGDAATVASLYTEDAVLCAPNVPMQRGRAAIQAAFEGMIQAMGQPTLKLETADVEESGGAAWEIGAYTLTAGGETDKGKYVVVWKREGNDWKLDVDIWNTDSPLPS
jgi:uncharacterized protein (TIGR02246 family)